MASGRKSDIFTVAAMTLSALLPGCTQIRVYTNDAVIVHNIIGVAELNIPSPTDVSYVETSGAGLVVGSRHMTLGWMDESIALFPDSRKCEAMIVVKEPDDIEKIQKLLELSGSSVGQICLNKGAK